MYYRHVVSKKVFSKIGHEMYWKTLRWAERRHPNKHKGWGNRKYFSRKGNLRNVFTDRETGSQIYTVSRIPIKRFVRVSSKHRVHKGTEETIRYWQKREHLNAYNQIESVKMEKLFKKQGGKCWHCNTPIKEGQI